MNKPVIAIVPLYDEERDSLWMLPGYMDGVIEAGGIPVMLSLVNDDVSLKETAHYFDGFIFAGRFKSSNLSSRKSRILWKAKSKKR